MNSRLNDCDFIDFGASKGGCIEFAKHRLGGRNGIGIDIDPQKVEIMRRNGHECVCADVTNLEFERNSVRFVTMSHVLEHLPDLGAVKKAIDNAARVASDFLFIQGPYFDADEYLHKLKLKFFWSDWHGHTCHLTTENLRCILLRLGLNEFDMMARISIKDSDDPAIHPWNSPRDQHEYDPKVHPIKPFISFSYPVYREMVCYVKLRPLERWKKIIRARKGTVPKEFWCT